MTGPTLVRTQAIQISYDCGHKDRANISVVLAGQKQDLYRRLVRLRVCRPVAHRSNSWLVAMIPNGSCRVWLTKIADPPPRSAADRSGLLARPHGVKVCDQPRRQHPEDRHVRGAGHRDRRGMARLGWLVPTAQ